MTPAEELAAAADKLDALAVGATDGRWEVLRHTLPESGVDRIQIRGAHKSWPSGRLSATTVASGIDAETADPDDSEHWLDQDDAYYIAAMNPLVGGMLGELLRRFADACVRDSMPSHDQWSRPQRADDRIPGLTAALNLARLINGSES